MKTLSQALPVGLWRKFSEVMAETGLSREDIRGQVSAYRYYEFNKSLDMIRRV